MNTNYLNMKRILLICLLTLFASTLYSKDKVRIKENIDFDWKFSLTDSPSYKDKAYSDSGWENIQLPHDWSITLDIDYSVGGSAAHLPGGIGWYRKELTIPEAYKNKEVSILFDAICHQSDVYINGHHLGFRPYGFTSIEYDLTPYLEFGGKNIIAIRVDRSGKENVARWYMGAGIYRHAWLQIRNPIHIATYGTYVTTPLVEKEKAELKIVTTVVNSTEKEQTVTVSHRVFTDNGEVVAKSNNTKADIYANNSTDITQEFDISNPKLWDITSPYLYTLETTIKVGGKVADKYNTIFGVRTIAFDSEKGFILNGNRVKLKGFNLHQDAGSLGVAVPDRSYERRLEIIKEFGCNAIRCAHNPPSPEFLDICDRMGFVVIDEAFDKWKSGYYEKYFDDWWQEDLKDMILRDRNHPSIILWSIGNEVQEAWADDDEGINRASMLQDFVHELEPSRLVTLAAQNGHRGEFSMVPDIAGYNYLEARVLSDRVKNPERLFYIGEELPYYSGEEGNIRSYTVNNPWNIVAAHDFIAGGFIWSGVDYLGEASGGGSHGWPNGLFDICMFEKPRAAYHRAMWNEEPMVSISVIDQSLDIDHGRDLWQWPKMASHWSFPDKYHGMIMEVRTTTNCEKVELIINDKSMGMYNTKDYSNNTIVWNVPYTPGKVVAKGYNGDAEVAQYELTTAKNTAYAQVTPDRTYIKADGQDLSHIGIKLLDENNNPVQVDDRVVKVSVNGEGIFRGLDSGDLRRKNKFFNDELSTYFGEALIIVQSTRNKGTISICIEIEGIDESYEVIINTI